MALLFLKFLMLLSALAFASFVLVLLRMLVVQQLIKGMRVLHGYGVSLHQPQATVMKLESFYKEVESAN